MAQHHSEVQTYQGLDFDTNWGSYNVYSGSMKAVVLDWRTEKAVKRFKGETAHTDANRWAYDLHIVHDDYDWTGSSTLVRLA
jgi:hypothetical protein